LSISNPFPPDWRDWRVNVVNASALAGTLSRERERALLFRTLATLRTDVALFDDVDQLALERAHTRFRRARGSIGRGAYRNPAPGSASFPERSDCRNLTQIGDPE
jgi:hypothetical protein